MVKILNTSKNTVIANNVEVADSFFPRMKGLLGRTALADGEGLVITHCQSIHMFFMRFAIDAIFIDRENYVIGLVENIKPFQLSPLFFRARSVIEVPVGTIDQTATAVGDKVKFE